MVRHKGDAVYECDITQILLADAEQRMAEMANELGQASCKLQFYVNAEDEAKIQEYLARGYEPVRVFNSMAIEMTDMPPSSVMPAGIEFVPFNPDTDMHALYQVHKEVFADHWGHTVGAYEPFSQNVQRGMDLSVCFLAMDGDDIAGYVLNRPGVVNTLGVRRPWRKFGLAYAMLIHAFQLFYANGCQRVELSVDSESQTGALRLYERAGMSVVEQYVRMEKTFGDLLP